MSQPKSGFEIRANLLSQAQDLLTANIDREYQTVYEWNSHNPGNEKELPLKAVNAEDVIAVAKQLNEFVNEK
jgi:hypothetical protein